jgi:hypothetical protein
MKSMPANSEETKRNGFKGITPQTGAEPRDALLGDGSEDIVESSLKGEDAEFVHRFIIHCDPCDNSDHASDT